MQAAAFTFAKKKESETFHEPPIAPQPQREADKFVEVFVIFATEFYMNPKTPQ